VVGTLDQDRRARSGKRYGNVKGLLEDPERSHGHRIAPRYWCYRDGPAQNSNIGVRNASDFPIKL